MDSGSGWQLASLETETYWDGRTSVALHGCQLFDKLKDRHNGGDGQMDKVRGAGNCFDELCWGWNRNKYHVNE
jgi:hypothetical protein